MNFHLTQVTQYKKPIITVSVLLTVAIISYFTFQTYLPKTLKQIEEVKGYSTERDIDLPISKDAKELGRSNSTNGSQITYQLSESSENTQQFYKNIMIGREWNIEMQTQTDTTTKTKYRKDNKRITITTSKQNDQTILSIEIFENF